MKNQEITNMLMDSAKIVHKILTHPSNQDLETTKILITGANTLAQTVKTMVQAEVVGLKLNNSKANTTQLIHSIVKED